MAEDPESLEFETIEAPPITGSRAKEESDQIENRPNEIIPNSVSLNLGKFGHVRWHAESGAPIFCFISILTLLFFGLLVAIPAAFSSGASWPSEIFKFLGQAVLTLVGAVVGASATASSGSRPRKPPSSKS